MIESCEATFLLLSGDVALHDVAGIETDRQRLKAIKFVFFANSVLMHEAPLKYKGELELYKPHDSA